MKTFVFLLLCSTVLACSESEKAEQTAQASDSASSGTTYEQVATESAAIADQLDVAKLEATTRPALIESVRTNAAMAELRDHSITMTYLYRDSNGEQVMRLSVGPAEYGR
jgi:hypothetical protein